MKKLSLKRVLFEIVSHASLVFSVFIFLLLFLDASDGSEEYINSYETGMIVTVYCILIFIAAVWLSARNYGRRCGLVDFILPHMTVVFSITVLTLAITNFFNKSMGFITSDMSKLLLMALAVSGALTSLSLIFSGVEEKYENHE